jgi:SAM-dependent methyltransferase
MKSIEIINPYNKKILTFSNKSLVDNMGNSFPLKEGAYRFVTDNNYTENFGFQWNKFEKTQIDRFQNIAKQSQERFFAVTKWDSEDLSNKNILEVGSGAGRFTQVVLSNTAGNLYSVDYSNAVEANFRNNGPNSRLHLFQASIYELPFSPGQFDKVFCFGVLQHTPDFKKSVECLVNMVKPGGELVIDFYPIRGWYTKIHAKYLLRPITRQMNHEKLLRWIDSNANRLIGSYRFFDKLGIGKIANRFLPVCDINGTIPKQLDDATLREWVVLDTFDMFSPAFDQPQRLRDVENWFREFRMTQIKGEVTTYGGRNEVTSVRGIK